MDVDFCVEALGHALGTGKPEIFNTDQGSQFTSRSFTGVLEAEGIMISMDGRGRVYDNIFVERLWRSVKYEEVYLKEYKRSGKRSQVSEPTLVSTTRSVFIRLSGTRPRTSSTPVHVPPVENLTLFTQSQGVLFHLKKDHFLS